MLSSQIDRKLAAIMFTDIAGYTALSANDYLKVTIMENIIKQIF